MKKLLVIFISITSIVQGQTTGNVDTTKFDFNLDSKPFNKIEDILSLPYFQGKTTYIDIGGYGCAVCMREATHYKQLVKNLSDSNFAYLFIDLFSPIRIPSEDYILKVKNFAYRNELYGYHIFAWIKRPTKISHTATGWDIIYEPPKKGNTPIVINTQGDYSMPRYMIANKKGKIVNLNAPRPSEKLKLLTFLKKVSSL